MSSIVEAGPVADVLTRLEADLDELATVGVGSCTDDGLLDTWRRLETVRRRLEPVDHAIVTEVETRSLPSRHACKSTAVLARQLLRIAPGEAHARVLAARNLGPRLAHTGQPLGPVYPAVAAAQADGAISARHARVITDMIERLPDEIAAVCDRVVEQGLVDVARQHDPDLLARHARALGYRLDQDGQYKDDAYRQRHRELHLRRRADGSARLDGELTPECAEHLATQLDALAKPNPATDGTQDPRSPGQRRHDGLLEMLKLVERANLIPTAGGCPATIVLTMDAEAYATGTGSATTGHGYTVPADVAKTWAGPEARIIAVLLSKTKGIQAYSTAQRLFTEQQRLVLLARDGGCCFPACDAPPQQCQVHHVTEFKDSKRTSVDDGVLLCGFHHRNFEAQGWSVTMTSGRPWWTPPRWLDPDQAPRRNSMHDRGTDP